MHVLQVKVDFLLLNLTYSGMHHMKTSVNRGSRFGVLQLEL